MSLKGLTLAATIGTGLAAFTIAPMVLTGAIAARCPQADPTGTGAYVNPFTVGRWSPSRTDQGVDWVPIDPSPVVAIGDGVVTYSASVRTGWPGGAFLSYLLTGGLAAGHTVYVAEHLVDLAPAGTVVQAGQVVATALPGYPWTEWGWAAPSGPEPAVPYNGAADGSPTAGGSAFARFLRTLGVKTLDDPGPGPLLPDDGLAAFCPNGTGSAQATTATGGVIATPIDFANALLARLEIAPNPGNVAALVAWQRAEGGWAHNNPLNTTLSEPGASDLPDNAAHVKVYSTMDAGVTATVSVLRERPYAAVGAALAGSDPYAVARAVAASPWGTPDFSAMMRSSGISQPAG
jgi:hypothetical protein